MTPFFETMFVGNFQSSVKVQQLKMKKLLKPHDALTNILGVDAFKHFSFKTSNAT